MEQKKMQEEREKKTKFADRKVNVAALVIGCGIVIFLFGLLIGLGL